MFLMEFPRMLEHLLKRALEETKLHKGRGSAPRESGATTAPLGLDAFSQRNDCAIMSTCSSGSSELRSIPR